MRNLRLTCGVPFLAAQVNEALRGAEPAMRDERRIVVDAPWGWAAARPDLAGTVVVTSNPCPEYRLDVLDAGAAALLSGFDAGTLIRTLRQLDAGERPPAPILASPLTRAERETLRLVALGHPNREVAARRGVSVGTVKNALKAIYQKLGLGNRVQLSHYYFGNWHLLNDFQLPTDPTARL